MAFDLSGFYKLQSMRVAQAITQNQVKAAELVQFDAAYHQFHQAVYANICKMVCEPQMAEDILQEVFLSLWEHRQSVDLQNAGGWLFVVSYNKSMSFLKKKLRDTSIYLPDTAFLSNLSEEQPVDEELFQLRLSMVEEAIDHLPPRKREVFRLCRFDGKSYDEVADMMNISVVSVKDYLKQSTQFIRQYISRHYNNIEIPGIYLFLLYFSQQG
jgi:RNA polymerase sigma-70 factor (ECF subfamily)